MAEPENTHTRTGGTLVVVDNRHTLLRTQQRHQQKLRPFDDRVPQSAVSRPLRYTIAPLSRAHQYLQVRNGRNSEEMDITAADGAFFSSDCRFFFSFSQSCAGWIIPIPPPARRLCLRVSQDRCVWDYLASRYSSFLPFFLSGTRNVFRPSATPTFTAEAAVWLVNVLSGDFPRVIFL